MRMQRHTNLVGDGHEGRDQEESGNRIDVRDLDTDECELVQVCFSKFPNSDLALSSHNFGDLVQHPHKKLTTTQAAFNLQPSIFNNNNHGAQSNLYKGGPYCAE